MEYTIDERRDMMGEFHNQVVHLVDSNKLTPTETIAILRMIARSIEKLFEVSVKGGK